MKQYVVDELRIEDHRTIKAYLDAHFETSGLGGSYRLPLPEEMLASEQAAHVACRPLYFAVTLEAVQLTAELLVRTNQRLRCSCMGYADASQRNWLISTIDAILDRLGVIV